MTKVGEKMKSKKKIYWICAIAVILAAIGCAIYAFDFKNEDKPLPQEADRYKLENGIVIDQVSQYSGPFVENGEDQEVEDVWELTLTNTSDQDIQFLRLKAECEGQTAQFDVTTLTAGSTVKVLESSAAQLPDWEKDAVYSIENIAKFQAERTVYPDLFQIFVADNRIKLVNKTEEDFTKDIFIYYKNVKDGVYQGGITYRARFEGGIAAEETKEVLTGHFDPEFSKIMYMTIE